MVSTADSSLQDVTHSELVLRICGSSRRGQVIRLGAPKCTVGSGPNCTLRVLAKGVQPLHCLIVRGPAATVVRCWGPDTRLNGRQFHDAPLSPGDRLSVGPIEFEVLPARASDRPLYPAGDGQIAHAPAARRIYRQARRLARMMKTSRRQNRCRVRRLAQEVRSQRQRVDELARSSLQPNAAADEAALGREELSRDRLELDRRRDAIEETHRRWLEEQAQAEGDLRRQAEELQALRVQIEARSRSLDEQREHWEADRRNADAEWRARIDTLQDREAEYEARQQAWQNETAQWRAQQEAAERQTAERTKQVAAELAELQAERKALAEEQSRWETERAEIEQQLHVRSEALAVREAELEAAAAAFPQDRGDMGGTTDLLHADRLSRTQSMRGELEFEAVSADSPVSSQDIFRRLGNMPSFEEGGAPASVSSPTIPLRSIASDAVPPLESTDGEEESIDDYMARLLARVRGDATSDGIRCEPAPAAIEPPAAVPPGASVPVQRVIERGSTASGSDAPAVPRVAPETLADLRTMRELANLSAHSALDRHSRQMLNEAIRSKLMVAALAVAACLSLGWIWFAFGRHGATLAAAGLSLLVACYWTVQYAVLTGRLNITRTGHLDWNRKGIATATAAVEPAPTDDKSVTFSSPVADLQPHAVEEAEPAVVKRPE